MRYSKATHMVVEQSEVDAKMLEDETNRVSLDARYLGRRAAEYCR